jgi:hypothetical protein
MGFGISYFTTQKLKKHILLTEKKVMILEYDYKYNRRRRN